MKGVFSLTLLISDSATAFCSVQRCEMNDTEAAQRFVLYGKLVPWQPKVCTVSESKLQRKWCRRYLMTIWLLIVTSKLELVEIQIATHNQRRLILEDLLGSRRNSQRLYIWTPIKKCNKLSISEHLPVPSGSGICFRVLHTVNIQSTASFFCNSLRRVWHKYRVTSHAFLCRCALLTFGIMI